MSFNPLRAHRPGLESDVVAVAAVEADGRTFHEESKGTGCGMGSCHQVSGPVELGKKGAGRRRSIVRGGGASRETKRLEMAFLASSLLPPSSSPAPSSSSPSRA